MAELWRVHSDIGVGDYIVHCDAGGRWHGLDLEEVAKRLNDLQAQIAAAPELPRWVPVSEGLPPARTAWVIACLRKRVWAAILDHGVWMQHGTGLGCATPTHWMLPPMPNGDKP